jgi:hypothetical protein
MDNKQVIDYVQTIIKETSCKRIESKSDYSNQGSNYSTDDDSDDDSKDYADYSKDPFSYRTKNYQSERSYLVIKYEVTDYPLYDGNFLSFLIPENLYRVLNCNCSVDIWKADDGPIFIGFEKPPRLIISENLCNGNLEKIVYNDKEYYELKHDCKKDDSCKCKDIFITERDKIQLETSIMMYDVAKVYSETIILKFDYKKRRDQINDIHNKK